MEFTQDWFSQHIPHLTQLFAPLAGRDGVEMLEIGCFEGRSTVWFLDNVLTGNGASITVIDTFQGSEENAPLGITRDVLLPRFLRNVEAYRDRVTVLDGESGVLLRRMPREQRFDAVYVDGSHQTPDVLEDTVLSWPLLRTGGLMVFDDYTWRLMESRPGPAIDAFLELYTGHYDLLYKQHQVAVRKTR